MPVDPELLNGLRAAVEAVPDNLALRLHVATLLLDAGRPAESEQAFRADLVRFPENGWSLRGLADALRDQGQTAESKATRARFDRIWEGAPVSH